MSEESQSYGLPPERPLPPQWMGKERRNEDRGVADTPPQQPGQWTPAYPPPPPGWGQQPPMVPGPGGYYPQPGWQPPANPADKHRGIAVASLILGIVGLLMSLTINIAAIPAGVCAITGFIFAVIAYSDQRMAKAAIWLCIAAGVLSVWDIVNWVQTIRQVTGS